MGELAVLIRLAHILSAALIVGGLAFARFAALPSLEPLDADRRSLALKGMAARFRPWIAGAMAALLASGLYNLLRAAHPTRYWIAFGVKALLALHIFSAAMVSLRPDEKQRRRLTGIVISGLLVLTISAYLRSL